MVSIYPLDDAGPPVVSREAPGKMEHIRIAARANGKQEEASCSGAQLRRVNGGTPRCRGSSAAVANLGPVGAYLLIHQCTPLHLSAACGAARASLIDGIRPRPSKLQASQDAQFSCVID